jgi:hypothetical protein
MCRMQRSDDELDDELDDEPDDEPENKPNDERKAGLPVGLRVGSTSSVLRAMGELHRRQFGQSTAGCFACDCGGVWMT